MSREVSPQDGWPLHGQIVHESMIYTIMQIIRALNSPKTLPHLNPFEVFPKQRPFKAMCSLPKGIQNVWMCFKKWRTQYDISQMFNETRFPNNVSSSVAPKRTIEDLESNNCNVLLKKSQETYYSKFQVPFSSFMWYFPMRSTFPNPWHRGVGCRSWAPWVQEIITQRSR